jgi:hypothetical protein
MYFGYILFCSNATQQQCLSNRKFTCADQQKMTPDKIIEGTVLFLFNTDDKSLLGPFTALNEGGKELDAGAWAMDIEENAMSENVKVTWEDLHKMQNAPEKLAFLRDPKTCKLTDVQTIRALNMLKAEPLYLFEKR